ncbi:ATP-binding cassette domain-containing protein [Cereibacter sediminicola]|uniref:ATP-binding cassette domain-containing protein n=1 Tax=Cereibacter sediminicola TaxID=2584941 RepID=UPI001FE4E703|nr:ATP-binding cassette domain-containing protein [Cereibacter sediminicola]
MLALLRQGLADGGGLICITHDLELASGLGGEILVMRGGTVVERGPAGRLLSDPQHPYTRALIAANPAHWPRPVPRPAGAAILRAEGLALSRGGRRLFSDLNLTLAPGEVVGIEGPSGCGKSSLGNVLLGLLAPDRGTVWRDPAAPRFGWQKIWQDPPAAFPPRLALGQGLKDLARRHRIDPAQIPPLLDRLNLRPALLERTPAEVSGGELQRLAILRALLLDPVMLFADEPTSRLDPVTQAEAVRLLADLARAEGLALLFVSHDRALLAAICDRILTLR